jgi:hypothetical protein
MTISTHLTRLACGTAAAGVLLLGGAGIAQAQEETPRPGPPSAPQTAAPQSAAPQAAEAPGAPAPSQASTAPHPGPQVRAVPEGAPETGGGPADPALATVAALVGGGALALAAAGAVTVAVRRRT